MALSVLLASWLIVIRAVLLIKADNELNQISIGAEILKISRLFHGFSY